MNKPVILTGIRSNEEPTIGNYFGAMLPLVEMARSKSDEFQVNIFVPDLHSFTTPVDYQSLFEQTHNTLKKFVAAGLPLDNDDVHIYRQSYIPAHSELTVILNNFTGFGEMSRMTQFKDKTGIQEGLSGSEFVKRVEKLITLHSNDERMDREVFFASLQEALDSAKIHLESEVKAGRVSVGLFDYPVLMAADILLYGASYVPVGDDQTQHLEITRDLGQRLNATFNQELFVLPKPVKEQRAFFHQSEVAGTETHQGLRIKDLADPTKKMSKSDESGKGVIFLSDDPKVAAKKVMSATTDDKANIQFNPTSQPGISNLMQILALLQGSTLQDVIDRYSGQTQYGEFKKDVASAVEEFLIHFQSKLAQVDEVTLQAKLQDSEAKMNKVASATLLKVQKAVGLR